MVYFFIAPGFEEAEAVIPYDFLKRAEKNCVLVSFSDSLTVQSVHGLSIVCDVFAKDTDISDSECIVLPGGKAGADNIDKNPLTDGFLRFAFENGIYVAAICAAPSVLGKRGYLRGKKATCYPGFEKYLDEAAVTDARVVCDGKITTAKGAGAAFEFVYCIVEKLADKQAADSIKEKIY